MASRAYRGIGGQARELTADSREAGFLFGRGRCYWVDLDRPFFGGFPIHVPRSRSSHLPQRGLDG